MQLVAAAAAAVVSVGGAADEHAPASEPSDADCDWAPLQELWYVLRMQNATAGIMQSMAHQNRVTQAIRTTEEMT